MKHSASHVGRLHRLLSLAKGYMPSRILLTALELEVFGRLGKDRLNASQLAQKMSTDERATEILLNALAGLELLTKKDGLFENIGALADMLMPNSPAYEGSGLLHNANLWEPWSHLTETVKTGQPHARDWTDGMSENLASAMRQHARSAADKMGRALDFSKVNRMLDLGGGPGSYALALARRYPDTEAVIFDRDDRALNMAREEIEKQKLERRVSLKKGDFFVDDLGNDYDLALLSSIICICSEEQNIFLLEKVNKSLTTGGRVVIRDSIVDESRTKPAAAAIFSVNMLVTTPNGRSYSFSDVKNLLAQSGFSNVLRIPIDGTQLVIGEK